MEIRDGEAAQAIRSELESKIASGKISKKAIKDFLKQYYDGDPDCQGCPTGCKEPEQCFIDIHLALIDDSGIPQPFQVGYIRDGVPHCCGMELKHLSNNVLYCTICGSEHGEYVEDKSLPF
jgi:hypothetical protein